MGKKRIQLFVFFISAIYLKVSAEDYKSHAKEIRDIVWNWNIDSFKEYTTPPEYANESAIIIAHHQQLEAASKNKFRMNALLMGDVNRELYFTNINRFMVKLNDKKALDEYAELSFKEEVKTMGYMRSNKVKTVVGVRIIKPNGTIHEIDVDQDAVAITEGKKDNEAYKKLAIQGLEVGDIIDYFFSEERELETENIPPQTFLFFAKYPTLSHTIECVFGKKLTVEYRSINGAPDFKKSIDENQNTVLKTEQKNLKIESDLDNTRWVSLYRSLPMIRMMILNNSSKLIGKTASARGNGVYKNVGYDNILKDKQCELAGWSKQMYSLGGVNKKVKLAVENYKQKMPGASTEGLASYIYDALRFYWPNNTNYFPDTKFCIALEKLLKENNIECKICFVTNRFLARQYEIVQSDDLSVFVSANSNKQLFFYSDRYMRAGEIPFPYEGEYASAMSVKKYNLEQGLEGTPSAFQIPTTSFDENKSTVTTNVVFSESDPLELQIKRKISDSGNMKDDYLSSLALFEDWDKEMRKNLLIEKDFWQENENDKDFRKYEEKYKSYFEEKRQKQKEFVQSEFKEYHSTNSGELINYSVPSLGITKQDSLLRFETEYKIDGLVKRAGNNLILDAGRLIGTQWTPTEKDRNRDFDAYVYYPMSIEQEISVAIPSEYTVEGTENLNKSIDNEFGKFNSSAYIEGNTLKIKTLKIYKRNFVSKNNWKFLLEMLDTTNKFYAETIMLKHKN